jgi:hypothetical protein
LVNKVLLVHKVKRAILELRVYKVDKVSPASTQLTMSLTSKP